MKNKKEVVCMYADKMNDAVSSYELVQVSYDRVVEDKKPV